MKLIHADLGSQPPGFTEFMVIVLERQELPRETRCRRSESLFGRHQFSNIFEDKPKVPAATIALVNGLGCSIDRQDHVVEAGFDNGFGTIERHREVRRRQRVQQVLPGPPDNFCKSLVQQRLSVVVERNGNGKRAKAIQKTFVSLERQRLARPIELGRVRLIRCMNAAWTTKLARIGRIHHEQNRMGKQSRVPASVMIASCGQISELQRQQHGMCRIMVPGRDPLIRFRLKRIEELSTFAFGDSGRNGDIQAVSHSPLWFPTK